MSSIEVNGRRIGPGFPVYIVAEMSANHNQSFEQAAKIVYAAKDAGADAVKLQTYTPDTMTIRCDRDYFRTGKGTIWEGRNLYELYGEAFTPWDWQPRLKNIADGLGIDLFSTPFDDTSVDFLENLGIPAYKVASFEVVDLPLLRRIAKTRRPIIMSTGMSTLSEIDEAVRTLRDAGGTQLALLKCTSAYPSPAAEMNLRTIPHLSKAFRLPVGLSDHTLDNAVSIAAVTLGACLIEKHFTLSRNTPGPDSAFSVEPHEFKAMVESIRVAEDALGHIHYEVTPHEQASRVFRRSLFVVQDMKPGDVFTQENVRSIRPGYGLHTRYLDQVIGHHATRAIDRGTPLAWDLVGAKGTPPSIANPQH